MKQMIYKKRENVIAVITIGIIAFFFLMKSPLHPWINQTTGVDSSVFKTVVMMMEKGGMPYVDSFDHKGPLLYILNWFGNRISQYRGIWVIEFCFLVVTVSMIYKISRLACNKKGSVITTFMAVSLLFEYFEGGNLTEEYAMTFIAVAQFIFWDYFLNEYISKIRLIICGLCFGCVILLRPNMVSVWFVMCIGVLFKSIVIDKNRKKIWSFLVWFLIGTLIIVFPVVIWLAVNGALDQCIHDYIIFNMAYNSKEGGRALFSAKWNSYFYFAGTTVYLISLLCLVIFRNENNKILHYFYLLYLLITPLFVCLSGMTYGHYGMILVPAVAYPIALVFQKIESINFENVSKVLFCVVTVYCISSIVLTDWISLVKNIPLIYEERNEDHRNGVINDISNVIDSLIDPNEKISVYGNWDAVYVKCNRAHATRYSYQNPIGAVMPEIMDEYFEQLQEEQPHVIVIQSGRLDEVMNKFLNDNKYEMVWSQNEESLDGALVYYK